MSKWTSLGATLAIVLFVAQSSATAEDTSAATNPGDPNRPDVVDAIAEPAEKQGRPELIKPVESDHIGEMQMPAFWEVSEVPDGIRAVEPEHERPAAIEVGAIPLPQKVPAQAVADALVVELQRSVPSATVIVSEPDPASDGVDRVLVTIEADDGGIRVRYAVAVVSQKKRALVVWFASPVDRFDSFEPKILIDDLIATISN